jgi:hypothetical protein
MFRSSATGGITKSLTHLRHSTWRHRGNETPKRITPNRVDVVEVHDAVARNAVIIYGQIQFGHEAACRASQRGNDDSTYSISDRIARQDEHRSIAASCGSKPDVTALHRPSPTNPPPAPSQRFRRAPTRSRSVAGRSRPGHRSRQRVARGGDARRLSTTPSGRHRVNPPSAEYERPRRRPLESSSSSYQHATTYDTTWSSSRGLDARYAIEFALVGVPGLAVGIAAIGVIRPCRRVTGTISNGAERRCQVAEALGLEVRQRP